MKSGKVVFLGETNVGKSSLLNKMIGEQVSIVTDMLGTTRNEIRGFKTTDDYQIIFLDVPGMQKVRNQLDKLMTKSISYAVANADVICYVLDATSLQDEHIKKLRNYDKPGKPVIAVLNKIDAIKYEQGYPILEKLSGLGFLSAIVPISAKTGKNLEVLEAEIVKFLPEGVRVVDEDEFTDKSVRELAAEAIRGELIKNLDRDVPHGIAVEITKWEETEDAIEIRADILCMKPSHKPIIIGNKGRVLKQVGIEARKKIQYMADKHVRLYTHVVVREDWKNKTSKLEELGYVGD